MTLDEAIEKEEYLAVLNCDTATTYHTDDNIIYNEKAEIYREKAEYHAQIAEWLSELYVYRNADEVIRRVRNGDSN